MLLAQAVSKQSKKSETEAAKLQQQLRGTNNLTNFARSGAHGISSQPSYLSSLSDIAKSLHKAGSTTKTETQQPAVESKATRPLAAEHQSKGAGGAAIEKQNVSAKGVEKAPAHENSADMMKGPGGEKAPPAASDKTTLAIEKVVTKGEKSPRTPEEDPAFQSVLENAKRVAKQQGQHEPAQTMAAQAQAAAVGPPNEVESQAEAAQVEKMDAQKPGHFDRAAFKAALLEKIASVTPKNLEEADDFKKDKKASSIKDSITSSVEQGKESSQGAIKETTIQPPDPSSVKPKEHTDLPAQQVVPSPQDIGARQAAPKPRTDSEISLQEGSQSIETHMTEAEISEEQLARSNEPQFQDALKAKKDAQQHSKEAPAVYRQEEQAILASSQEQSSAVAQVQIQSMHQVRQREFDKVTASQITAKSVDEQKRAQVYTKIEAIYSSTKQKVQARLSTLDEEVHSVFDSGLEQATREFEDYIHHRMSAYKEERYSGLGGKALWAKDELFSMPDEVNKFYEEGLQKYVEKMNVVIDSVATIVETGLNEAKEMISAGRQEVKTYVESLPKALQNVGKEAAENIESKFDELNQSLDEKNNQLVDSLSQKYVENMNKVHERINEMKAENKGLVDKAKDAIVEASKTILQLKDMLLSVLAKVANVVSKIIKDPIGFVGNLVKGVKAGLNNFIGKIGEYLKQGLFEWLFGALSQAGIQMPESLDLKGILSLVMQVLGLTYPAIRARAVKIVGERVVKGLEQASEIFMILVSEGPSGLWKHIQEKIGDLKETVIEGIKGFLKEKIITAGITWIMGLLTPASAFIKAAKAIYDIVMFFVTRGSQIMSLVDAIIDSMASIADGGIGVAAAAVEKALGRAVPAVIGFLASLLGLGGISEKIQGIIQKVQAPVTKAVDWVINKAIQLVKAAGKLFDGRKDEKPKMEKTEEKEEEIAPEKLERWENGSKEVIKLVKEYEQKQQLQMLYEGLANIKVTYGFSELNIVQKEEMEIYGSMSPGKRVTVTHNYPLDKIEEMLANMNEVMPHATGKIAIDIKMLVPDRDKRKESVRQDFLNRILSDPTVPLPVKQKIVRKGDGKLASPGLEAHHIQPLWLNGPDEVENLVLLPDKFHRLINHQKERILKIIGNTILITDPVMKKAIEDLLFVPDFSPKKYAGI